MSRIGSPFRQTLRIEEERVDCPKCGQLRTHNGACSRRQLWRAAGGVGGREERESMAKRWNTRLSSSLGCRATAPWRGWSGYSRRAHRRRSRRSVDGGIIDRSRAIERGKGRGCRRTQSARSPAARFAVRVYSRLWVSKPFRSSPSSSRGRFASGSSRSAELAGRMTPWNPICKMPYVEPRGMMSRSTCILTIFFIFFSLICYAFLMYKKMNRIDKLLQLRGSIFYLCLVSLIKSCHLYF